MILIIFKKMSIVVNCRKSNKKHFFTKSSYINTFEKSGKIFMILSIAF